MNGRYVVYDSSSRNIEFFGKIPLRVSICLTEGVYLLRDESKIKPELKVTNSFADACSMPVQDALGLLDYLKKDAGYIMARLEDEHGIIAVVPPSPYNNI